MTVDGMAVTTAGAGMRRPLAAARPRYGEKLIKCFFAVCAGLSVAVTTAIVISLLVPAVGFFQDVSIVEFFTETEWSPAFATAKFGVAPIVVGTLMVTGIALMVAVPLGLLTAIYLSEYAPRWVRKVVKPVLEVLEGVPTVAIGLWALWFLRERADEVLPFVDWGTQFSVGVAGVAVGVLIIPLVASVSDDAMRSVPSGLREGAHALGGRKLNVSARVVVPGALSGIIAGVVLGASRAIGETMVVLIAAGSGFPDLRFDPTEGIGTMTTYIAGRATGDIAQGTVVYDSIFAVGSLLFVMTLAMNMLAIKLVRRFREVYE